MERIALLERAAPGQRVVQREERTNLDPPQLRAQLTLPARRVVEFAYLDELEENGLPLRLYPADTLEQARIFYGSPLRVLGTLGLRQRGWEVRPNFHWGYRERGFCWTRSQLSVDDYARYWIEHIKGTKAPRREEWPSTLHRLIEDGVLDQSELGQFEMDFTQTKRPYAAPRPGLSVTRWFEPKEGRPLAVSIAAAIEEAVAAFGDLE